MPHPKSYISLLVESLCGSDKVRRSHSSAGLSLSRCARAIILLTAVGGAPVHGQVESPAVGFNILSLAPGSGENSQLTFGAPQYGCAVMHQAVSTALGATTLVDAAASWADDLYNGDNGPHYIEITQVGGSATAPAVGVRREIVDTIESNGVLVVDKPWPTGLTSPVHYRIIKHWTIRELFGATKGLGIASEVSGTTLVDASANWSVDEFNGENGAHFVEVVRVSDDPTDPNVGTRREIVGTALRTLAVNEPWPVIDGIVSYRIVRHMAVRSNTSGNLRGGTSLSADSFQLWDGERYETYYYQSGGIGGIGWRKAGDQFSDAGGTIIHPGQAIIFRRGETVPLHLVVRGFVKDGITPLEVQPGFNFLANPYASSMTLASAALYTGSPANGVASGSLLTADQVMVWTGALYDTYYYQASGLGGVGWRKVGDLAADASAEVIPAGASIIIRRQHNNPFTWRIPAHPVQ